MIIPSTFDLTSGPQDIEDFYKNRNILLTGASGFLGKLLLEKILRLNPNVNNLFVILRAKKEKSHKTRFDELFGDVIFDRLKKENPEFAKKIVLIKGDIGQIDLGLSPEDRELLRTTHVVLHSAASVRFNEPIREAVNINVRGTKQLVSLAKGMPNLKAFVHVSTAYSNCVQELIEEKFYPPPMNSNELLSLTDILDNVALERLTPLLLGKWPNTYSFTKAIAEDIIRQSCKDLPLCVVRPSVILSTYREPVAGWISSTNTSGKTIFYVTLGMLRSLHSDKNMIADIVPADYVTDSVIVAAWDIDRTRSTSRNDEGTSTAPETEACPVYNVVSACQKPITWGEFWGHVKVEGRKVPSVMCLWYCCLIINKHSRIHSLCTILLHFMPAIVSDIVAWSVGRKPMMISAYRKMQAYNSAISYFTTRQWQFRNDHTMEMWKSLSPADQTKYNFNIESLVWEDYLHSFVCGSRVYLAKDPMDTLQKGRAKYAKLQLAHYTLVTILCGIVVWFLWIFSQFLASSSCFIVSVSSAAEY